MKKKLLSQSEITHKTAENSIFDMIFGRLLKMIKKCIFNTKF